MMIRTKLLFLLVAGITTINSIAQSTHSLVSIGDESYSVEEFDFIYNKNNNFSEEPKSKKEYIDLFVNYKLKVTEAKALGLDTIPSFIKEYNYYKNELAKPYLSDKSVTDKLIKEAYNRITHEVEASHILIRLNPSPTPEDTLKAYEKISSILERHKEGEDFNKLALQYSEDPSAKKNQGKLGYFSGFMMVYPFESAAYNTPVGEVSTITRTSFGYHIIKVHNKRENRGELLTAHIMQIFPANSSAEVVAAKKAKIDSVYQLVLDGEDFGELAAKYSEDRNSANRNGELAWFGSGRMIPEYSEPAFKLDSVNNISEVIRTPYGFHIIKFLDKRGVKSFEEMEEEITNRISKDERAFQGKKAVIERLKKEYNYTENSEQTELIKTTAGNTALSNEDFFNTLANTNSDIATLDGLKIKTTDFIASLKENKQFTKQKRATLIDQSIDTYIEDKIIDYEKTKLEDKYPDYKYLLNEYHDGLLIFEISQKEIWNKAMDDSLGIANHYEANKGDYFYPEKLDGKLILSNDSKTIKEVKKLLKANAEISGDSLKQIFNKDSKAIKVLESVFEQGEYKAIDKQIWKIKKSEGKTLDDYKYAWTVGTIIPKEPKNLEETRGQVIADYQSEIEERWINELKSKYNPVVNTKALKYSKKEKK
ncbi:hypothetical protein E9993_10145 [Labilibacter sediminis]|nr:hypothetical protein E9993_10145 [Labilibacter sediminis]